MKQQMRIFSAVTMVVLTSALAFPQTALAQDDAAMQAAQQATQDAMQATQQANTMMQQASQQAMQNAQNAAMDNTPGYSSSSRQQPPAVPSPNTPVPAQIRTAHSVFLANDGSDPNFPLDPNTAYSAFYDAIQAWGHYQLAPSAQQADLVFQLHGVAPITEVSGDRYGVYSSTSPAFQLTIRDPKTNTRLWTVTSPVFAAPKRSTIPYWQGVAVTNLVSRVKVLSGQPLSSVESASLTTVPNYHHVRNAAILAGAGAAATVAITVITVHEMQNSQANFCNAHNIPLSQCAGS
jgi:type II secretory pathway pseudopilin PulG